MKIEKINDNKIKIILSSIDLKEKNIDVHSFISNSIESQELFWDILDQADKEIGFNANGCQLIIEALAVNGGDFILTVTKVTSSIVEDTFQKLKFKKPKITAKMRNNNFNDHTNIFVFNNFENFLNLCSFVSENDLKGIIEDVKLYKFKEDYYLTFKIISNDLQKLKTLSLMFSEFGNYVRDSELFERKILEYGEIICEDNAILILKKHFVKKNKKSIYN